MNVHLPAFRWSSLTFGYSRPLFLDFTVSLDPGDLVWIRGGNGSGKSTLLKLSAGLIQAHKGHLERRMPMLYLGADTNGLLLNLSSTENLTVWAQLLGLPCKLEALQTWQLGRASKLPVRHFSTGMRRRLALSRMCLYTQPTVILLDEPGLGLDVEGQKVLCQELARLRALGSAIMIVSHDELALLKENSRELWLS